VDYDIPLAGFPVTDEDVFDLQVLSTEWYRPLQFDPSH
jgi:hypothetical protein